MPYIFPDVSAYWYEFLLISSLSVLGFQFIGFSITAIHNTFVNQLQQARIAEQQKQVELNLLQSRLSPHFLFNTLNNMYGLSITKPELLPTMLLKLSDLLRYSVYDTKNTFVSLTDELKYIKNYIEFEQLRIGEKLNIQVNLNCIDKENICIAPMLLIVFIENAFKHSKNTGERKIEIFITLEIKDNVLCFFIKNTSRLDAEKRVEIKDQSGLGLATTLKRLNLLYPNQYSLKQSNKNGYYEIEFFLKIK